MKVSLPHSISTPSYPPQAVHLATHTQPPTPGCSANRPLSHPIPAVQPDANPSRPHLLYSCPLRVIHTQPFTSSYLLPTLYPFNLERVHMRVLIGVSSGKEFWGTNRKFRSGLRVEWKCPIGSSSGRSLVWKSFLASRSGIPDRDFVWKGKFRAMSWRWWPGQWTCTNIFGEVLGPWAHCCPCKALKQKSPNLNGRR